MKKTSHQNQRVHNKYFVSFKQLGVFTKVSLHSNNEREKCLNVGWIVGIIGKTRIRGADFLFFVKSSASKIVASLKGKFQVFGADPAFAEDWTTGGRKKLHKNDPEAGS